MELGGVDMHSRKHSKAAFGRYRFFAKKPLHNYRSGRNNGGSAEGQPGWEAGVKVSPNGVC
jgi:hypothetical protein